MDDNTIKFTVPAEGSEEMKRILTEVYRSLTVKISCQDGRRAL